MEEIKIRKEKFGVKQFTMLEFEEEKMNTWTPRCVRVWSIETELELGQNSGCFKRSNETVNFLILLDRTKY